MVTIFLKISNTYVQFQTNKLPPMKRITSLIILLAAIFVLPFESKADNRGYFAEIGIGYEGFLYYFDESPSEYVALISPTIGYRLSPKVAVGIEATIQVGKHRQYHPKITLFGEYDIISTPKFKLTTELKASWASPIDNTNDGSYDLTDLWEFGFSFGCSYSISRNWSILLRYPFIGYYNTNDWLYSNPDACLGNKEGGFMADFNLRRLQLGVRYTF